MLLIGLVLLLLLSGCTYWSAYARVDHSDPVIQLAEKQCGIDKADSESNDCYVAIALENKKPEVCLLANPSIDDWCIQDYYEKRGSIAACDEIRDAKPGSIVGCLEHYGMKDGADCNSFSYEECPSQCVVCPPCAWCSSIACRSEAFCNGIGFDKSGYEEIKKRLEG
ncbi:MAG: hypothetical protein WC634_02965 [archaeon]